VTTIHRLHPAPLVCIVCGKPARLNPDDEWEHTTVDDDLACTVWPMRVTENYKKPPVPDAAAAYDQQLLDKARTLANLHDIPQMRAYLTDLGVWPDETVTELDASVVAAYVLGRLQATTMELVRWLDRIPAEHRG